MDPDPSGPEAGTRNGTRPPGTETEPKTIECLLLAVAHHWSGRETAERQTELLDRFFDQEQMKTALSKLEAATGKVKLTNRQNGASKTATRAQAEDVVAALKTLGDADLLPRLTVQSDDLQRIAPLLNAVSIGDERGVAARLEALEIAMQTNQAEMMRYVTATRHFQAPVQPPLPPAPVRPHVAQGQSQDQSYANAVVAGGGRKGRIVQGQEPRSAGSHDSQRPPGQAGAGGQTPPTFLEPRPPRQRRKVSQGGGVVRSASTKRQRNGSEGEWQEVPPPRGVKKRQERGPTLTGTANWGSAVDLQCGVEIYLGSTSHKSTKELIQKWFYEVAARNNVDDFRIDDIVTLNKTPNPPTRSWKVRVPKRFEKWMLDPNFHQATWSFRKFEPHGSKRGVQTTGHEATSPRRAPRSPPKTVEPEATTEESMSGSSSLERMETTSEGATTATGESATWSEKENW